jgi:helicase SWR1
MPNEAELDGTAFANHKTFNEWFSSASAFALHDCPPPELKPSEMLLVTAAPLERAIEAGDVTDSGSKGVVDKLHMILRPYVLRRLKSEVEKGLPAKREHVVYCRLSKRQRFLYDEFMSRAETREKLSSNNVLTISNCLMKLRKVRTLDRTCSPPKLIPGLCYRGLQVCNHPDLFETRPIRTSFVLLDRAAAADYEIQELFIRRRLVLREARATVDLSRFDLHPSASLGPRNAGISVLRQRSMPRSATAKLDASEQIEGMVAAPEHMPPVDVRTIAGWKAHEEARKQSAAALACRLLAPFNNYKCQSEATVCLQPLALVQQLGPGSKLTPSDNLSDGAGTAWPAAGNLVQAAVLSYATRAAQNAEVIQQFAVIPPMAVAPDVTRLALAGLNPVHPALAEPTFDSLHQSAVAHQIAFPDASLIQYDCGKLQTLYDMFRKLKAGGHRALVFTQMARVLDILEIFLNLHGYRYLRLDGSTKVEDRQVLMESFNADDKIFCFIATTRSGGVGLNLTGADTVIMYDRCVASRLGASVCRLDPAADTLPFLPFIDQRLEPGHGCVIKRSVQRHLAIRC